MSGHRQYKVTDYRFGQLAVKLRENAGLTQMEVANALHVSRRTIQHWEGGTAFPEITHLKNLIAFYLPYGAFTSGHELDEARQFWEQADESAKRHRTPFDDTWFEVLLHQPLPGGLEKQKQARIPSAQAEPILPTRLDWGDAPDLKEVYGRERELVNLSQWVLTDECHVVAILGIGGIGKTTLAVKFAQLAASQFDSVIWRSLRNAPPLIDLLVECLQTLSPLSNTKPSIPLLLELLQQHRCLLILDNAETLHQAGSLAGDYREGFEEYRTLFQQVAQARHQSCLIVTSREIPAELEPFEGARETVRVMKLAGLSRDASQALLNEKELFGPMEAWDAFVFYYGGNPLALKIAASIVRDLFGGDLAAFLKEAPVTLHTLHHLLDNQFEHLSTLERDVLFWLAIERVQVPIEALRADLLGSTSKIELLPALMSLRRRSLIERGEQGAVFYLQPVLLEFITDRIVKLVSEEIVQLHTGLISKYALMKSKALDYVRESQVRLIVEPVLANLVDRMGDNERLVTHLRTLIAAVRKIPAESQGYAGGNIVNLLARLKGDICGEDFSRLALRQVYLQGVEAQDANFSDSEFAEARFTEPLETVATMMLSPSGQYLAAGTYSGQINFWRVADGKPLWTATGARHEWCLAFSPDERLMVSGGYHGQVCIWETSTGHLLKNLEDQGFWVYSVAFHPDGRTLVSGGSDETIRIWNIDEDRYRFIPHGHAGSIYFTKFSPDGKLLVTSGNDGKACIWDFSTGNLLREIYHSAGTAALRVALHPKGRIIATNSEEDALVKLWDLHTGEFLYSFPGHNDWSGRLAFNHDGSYLACGCRDGSVELWEISEDANPKFFKILIGNYHHINELAFGLPSLLATVSLGENIRLWDVQSGKLLRTFHGYSRLIGGNAFSPDGSLLVQGDANGMVRIYDVPGQRYLTTFKAHTGSVWCVQFSPDGRTFASASDDRSVKLWDAANFQWIKTIALNTGDLWSLVFTPDGSLLATAGTARNIDLWDTRPDGSTAAVRALEAPDEENWSLAIDPAGKILACGRVNGTAHLFDLETGQRFASLKHGNLKIAAMRFSTDGKVLITGSYHELIKWWDINTGECLGILVEEAAGNRNTTVAIGQDGALVVTGGNGPDLFIWHTHYPDLNPQLVRLQGHKRKVWAIALSQDERLVASSDEGGTTLISEIESGQVLQKISLGRPYERMNITKLTGLNAAERSALKTLGAIEGD